MHEEFNKQINDMTSSGIKLVSATYNMMFKRVPKEQGIKIFEDLLDDNGNPKDKSRKFIINYINQDDKIIKKEAIPKIHQKHCARTILEKALVDYSNRTTAPVYTNKSKVITV